MEKSNRLKTLIFILIPIFFFLLIFEGIVRIIRIDVIQNEPYFFGFTGRPDYFHLDASTDNVSYCTNEAKDIDKVCFLKDKPADEFRIFVLGGSAANGEPFGPQGSFSRFLQDNLTKTFPAKQFNVINAARKGFGSVRVFQIFNEIIHYDPDLVVVYFGNNEARDYLFHRFEINFEMNPFLRYFKRVMDHSHIFRMIFHTIFKKKVTSFGAQSIQQTAGNETFQSDAFQNHVNFLHDKRSILENTHGGNYNSILDDDLFLEDPKFDSLKQILNWQDILPEKFENIFSAVIRKMKKKSDELDVPLLFLTRSRNLYYNRDARLIYQTLDSASNTMKNTCRQLDIPVIETLPLLFDLFDEEIGFNAFTDIVHPTLQTNQIFAQAIVQQIRKDKIIMDLPSDLYISRALGPTDIHFQLNNLTDNNSQYLSLLGWQQLIMLNKHDDQVRTMDEVIALGERALVLDPSNEKAYFLLGCCYTITHQLDNAENIWKTMKDIFKFSSTK